MKQSVNIQSIAWEHISSPSNEDVVQIIRDAHISQLDAELIVHGDQGPQFVVREEYKIILIQVPVRETRTKSFENHTIRCIVLKNRLITITSRNIPALERILTDCTQHPELYDHDSITSLSFAFTIIDRINASTVKKIHHLLKRVEIAEDAVFHGNERKMVEEIAVLSRDVLDFHRVALPQRGVFQTLHRQYNFTHQEQDILSRIHHQSEQMWNTLQVLHSSMQELRNTNDSLLQHQENELLRMIFSYSIITVPLLAVINIFNPHRVGATYIDTIIFWSIIAFLTLLLVAIFARARKRRVL
ncbi:MAG TPA: CorA family divalent cation transporter [Candidatus Andersenbacteria bacterium]|nr:CorA family divalent cation transporter [Candidatus Andersenbacteria bacterium]